MRPKNHWFCLLSCPPVFTVIRHISSLLCSGDSRGMQAIRKDYTFEEFGSLPPSGPPCLWFWSVVMQQNLLFPLWTFCDSFPVADTQNVCYIKWFDMQGLSTHRLGPVAWPPRLSWDHRHICGKGLSLSTQLTIKWRIGWDMRLSRRSHVL